MEVYVIPFKGLSVGSHSFEWDIGKDFFAMYEVSEIEDADIKVQATMVKHQQFLEVNLSLSGWAEVLCDRCLDPVSLSIETEEQLIVKFDEPSGDDDDVIILSGNDTELDISHYLYEYAHLALPVRRVHEEGGCNKEMIARLEQYLVNDKNDADRDTRWSDLKNIFEN
jgi:uncharacterized metal-binding protein YceD (DUF177 family)